MVDDSGALISEPFDSEKKTERAGVEKKSEQERKNKSAKRDKSGGVPISDLFATEAFDYKIVSE